MTSPQEYQEVLDRLPGKILELVRPQIHQIEEILIDKGQNLVLNFGDILVEYPVIIDEQDIGFIEDRVGKFKDDARRGVEGTLHRFGGGFDILRNVDKITIRVGRAIMYVAEPLRELLSQARSVGVLGPPGVGKSTLQRDIARIKSEQYGRRLEVVDSSGELTGTGPVPHHTMRRLKRFMVPSKRDQARIIEEMARTHNPGAILVDEVGNDNDVPELVKAAGNGVAVFATMHGRVLSDVRKKPPLHPLFGITYDARSGEQVRRLEVIFDMVIEVHGKGRFVVHTDMAAAVDTMLAGGAPRGQFIGPWTQKEKDLAYPEDS